MRIKFDVEIFGLNVNGTIDLLIGESSANEIDLSNIDAANYPFIQLIAHTEDTLSFTAPQLKNWRVYYDMATELAIDPKSHFTFYKDTIQEGDNIILEMAVQNASSIDSDSLKVKYTIVDNNNESKNINYPLYAPIPAGKSDIIRFEYNTGGLAGNNVLMVEVNPDNHQTEKFHFNNFIQIPFFVIGDDTNPYLDVTFDGQHILDGDLVSAKPNILISAKDENPFLAMNDVNDYEISIRHPDKSGMPAGDAQVIDPNDNILSFVPATEADVANGNNRSYIELKPVFEQNGLYELIVKANDRTENHFTGAKKANYSVTFEIVNEQMISNVLNYPNPFTSSTRFIFDLTGSEVPDDMKIQIITMSGKVVKEIQKEELGALHIGRNITEYAWNGTDEFGNPLANGVYLYKVITKLNGQSIDQYKNNAIDDLFKKGWGKMYLMR